MHPIRVVEQGNYHVIVVTECSGPYFIKVKIILSLSFKINFILYLIKEFMKNSCVNFFYETVNKIKVRGTQNLKNLPRHKMTNSS